MRLLWKLVLPLLLSVPILMAQPPVRVRIFYAQPVISQLAWAWDDMKNPRQPERAYCAFYTPVMNKAGTQLAAYRIDSIAPAKITKADQYSTLFDCPLVPANVSLHTHPPTSCEDTTFGKWKGCRFGGPDAWECFPSPQDQESLDHSEDPFALIQCDRHAIVPHWRDMPSIRITPRKQ